MLADIWVTLYRGLAAQVELDLPLLSMAVA
jgi:hypothetical protein